MRSYFSKLSSGYTLFELFLVVFSSIIIGSFFYVVIHFIRKWW